MQFVAFVGVYVSEESAPVILVFTNEYAVPMKNVDLSAKLVVIVELT